MFFDSNDIIFFLLNFLIVYPLLFYPIVLAIISQFYKQKVKSNLNFKPKISILVSAYNEEELIEDCIHSIYQSDYELKKIEVICASDGSSDTTFNRLQSLQNTYPSLQIYDFERAGKNSVLNKLNKLAKNEIVFYLDADCRLRKDTLNIALSNFADDNIGAVICRMEVEKESSKNKQIDKGEKDYQGYESYLRIKESEIASTVNALGAFYAVRKEHIKEIHNDYVADDFVPILQTLSNQKRVIYLSEAIVDEVRKKSLANEFQRRIRMTAAGYAAFAEHLELIYPKYGFTSFFLWSHKLLRWLHPVFLIGLLAILILNFDKNIFYFVYLMSVSIILLFGIVGLLLEKSNFKFRFFSVFAYYISMIYGFIVAFVRFMKKTQNSKWTHKKIN